MRWPSKMNSHGLNNALFPLLPSLQMIDLYFISSKPVPRSTPQLYLVPGAVQRPSCHEKESQTENRGLSSQPAINPGLLYRASEFTCANRVENVVNRYFYDPLPIPQQFMDTSLTSCMYIAPYLLTSSHFFRRNQSRDRTETPISSSNCFNK